MSEDWTDKTAYDRTLPMTNGRLDGSGTVCGHCGREIVPCLSPNRTTVNPCLGWIHKESNWHTCEGGHKAEPAPAEQPRQTMPIDEFAEKAGASQREHYGLRLAQLRTEISTIEKLFPEFAVAASPAEKAPEIITYTTGQLPINHISPDKPQLITIGQNSASPAEGPRKSTFPEMEVRATVALDSGVGGSRRACNNENCSQDYQHLGLCDAPVATSPRTLDLWAFAQAWYETAKADDPHHFAEHEDGNSSHDGMPDIICEYTFEHFWSGSLVQAGLKTLRQYVAAQPLPGAKVEEIAKELVFEFGVQRSDFNYENVLAFLRPYFPADAASEVRELRAKVEEKERMIRVCENAFQLQEAFTVEGRAGQFNGLQIAKAWLELEKRAEAAEAQLKTARDALRQAIDDQRQIRTGGPIYCRSCGEQWPRHNKELNHVPCQVIAWEAALSGTAQSSAVK